mgnify:CR=1 FL=1
MIEFSPIISGTRSITTISFFSIIKISFQKQNPNPNIKENTIRFPRAQKRSQLLIKRPDSLKIIREAMFADVAEEEGTGQPAMIPDYNICGKTGTAEVKKPGDFHKITWFVSFGPFEKPKHAVVVMVERGVSGGKTCAPIAKEIYKALIDQKRDSRLIGNFGNPALSEKNITKMQF